MIEAEFTDVNVPVKLTVNNPLGGIAGLTVALEVLDGETQDSYLDFNDGIFKSAGWTTKSVVVADVGAGRYSLSGGLDIMTMVSPSKKLLLEYNISGAKSGSVSEELLLRASTFQAKVWMFDDDGTIKDRYNASFFKNSEPVLTGITGVTIQVIKAIDGTDLVVSTAMVEIAGGTGLYRHDEGTDRIVNGSSYFAKVQATIEGTVRTWIQPVGRDS